MHVIGCSINLHISYHCSSDFWEYGQRLVEYGQAIDPQNLLLSCHPLLLKTQTFGMGPPAPLNKHNRFQDGAPYHIKSCTAKGLDVYKGLLPWEGLPRQTCINHLRRIRWCKLMDQIQIVQQFCASRGRSFCHGNEHHGIDPSIFSSGHHESLLFHKGCLSPHSCQTAILPHVGTLTSAYWPFSNFQSAFISEKALVVVWSSFKKMTLGLALGESWPLLAQPQKNTYVQCPSLPIFVGRLS